MQVMWFKRDLRAADNAALGAAAQCGPVLPLYVAEPDWWQGPGMSARQWAFAAESLMELRDDLARAGAPLVVRTGDVISVLQDLLDRGHLTALWSHEETGNDWTYARDRRVGAWCRANGVPWHQVQQHGVWRAMASRDGWARNWDRFMATPVIGVPDLAPLPDGIEAGGVPAAHDLGLLPDPCPDRQIGGRGAGLHCLDTFLSGRGEPYQRAMSSPDAGARACSRLSPHLAWGTLSMREVTQVSKSAAKGRTGQWARSLKSFQSRLHWHCHFIQKLESDPRIEFHNMHPAYDGLRPSAPDQDRLAAWANGETGLPFVDACMRSLRATGWLNFRMRAMVMSVAAYHLWLDWRAPGLQLARYFTDFEPGIHWSQVQMQSGTTGINTVRIYNPIKQGYDQDPTGTFTRKWVPELAGIPDRFLHEPWRADGAGRVLGRAYPMPIVDHVAAAREARDRVWAVRRGEGHREQSARILSTHGSRKSRRSTPRKRMDDGQLSLPFDGDAR